jgi:hypothetical protein
MKYFLISFDILESYWVDTEENGKIHRTYGWMKKEHTSKLVEAGSYIDATHKIKEHFAEYKIANLRNDTL